MGSQSIQKAATSQTHWLIYCICWARPACLSGLKNLSYQSCAPGKPVSNRITWSCNIWKTRAYQSEWVVWKYSLWLLGFFEIMGTTLTPTSSIWVDTVEIRVSIWPQICLFTLNTIPSLIQPFCINYLGKKSPSPSGQYSPSWQQPFGSYFWLTRPGPNLNEWGESLVFIFNVHQDIKTSC